jgi:hypothetical protein
MKGFKNSAGMTTEGHGNLDPGLERVKIVVGG